MKALPWVVNMFIGVFILVIVSGCNEENKEFKNNIEKHTEAGLEIIDDNAVVVSYPAGSWDKYNWPEYMQKEFDIINKYDITAKITIDKEHHKSNVDSYKNKVDSVVYDFCTGFEEGFYSTYPKKAHFEWDINLAK